MKLERGRVNRLLNLGLSYNGKCFSSPLNESIKIDYFDVLTYSNEQFDKLIVDLKNVLRIIIA